MFLYPKDLVLKVIHKWKKDRPLPAQSSIEQFLEIAYHAGFQKDEHRRVEFYVVYRTEEDLQILKILAQNVSYLELATPRPYDVQELVKLSLAIDPSNTAIVVTLAESKDSRNPTLQIRGLMRLTLVFEALSQSRSQEIAKSNEEKPISDYLFYRPLNVYCDAPGILRIKLNDFESLVLADGKIREVNVLNDLLKELSGSLDLSATGFVEDFQQRWPQFLKKSKKSSLEWIDKDQLLQHYLLFLYRLLMTIKKLGHGGIVIVIPKEQNHTVWSADLRIKYSCKMETVWDLLLNNALVGQLTKEQLRSFLGRNRNRELSKYLQYLDQELITEKKIEDSLSFLSKLSQVDGALVITDHFELIGFGAEIIIPADAHEAIERFGTRHRSAQRFSKKNPAALVFAISQDGTLSIFNQRSKPSLD